ncbi:DNA-3-methyladenine glycosylase I [Gordonia rubripertincta]|uniref:DNA-3-methyladenine glycosylase I n=1 Tax=Gordonia rubripertincta TaxID=36822 RepID=A0ABT4MTJ6_GORRU|nr:DNA-3-methyladenine glycosylase I [Gordonia rubripertincta]MCZ4549571.1 DNA-3-methyladenine glycosylase I [Gordonia rubripertincta]
MGPTDDDLPEGAVRCEDGLVRPVWAAQPGLMRTYYDTEWGMPVSGENAHFERLVLEGFQAGLSWATILRKRPAFREVFCDFDVDTVAGFGDAEIDSLLTDARIIRHRGKIEAAIGNARATQQLRAGGGLVDFLWSFKPQQTPRPESIGDVPTTSPESVAMSKALRKNGFRFVGPTTMYALMEAIGIVDTHLMSSFRRGSSGIWND